MIKTTKTLFIYLSLIVVTAIMPSCLVDEKIEIAELMEKCNLSAYMDGGDETKTHMSELDGNVYHTYWSAGDQIAVYTDSQVTGAMFRLVSGENTAKGDFEGYGTGSSYVAIYPYSFAGNLSGNTVSLTLPEIQEYADNSFAPSSYPMIAVSGTNSLKFRNLCGIIRVSLTGTQSISSITLKSNSSSVKVSGIATVSTSFSDAPTLVMDNKASDEVTLECGNKMLNPSTATEFNIIVPAQKYTGGITLTIRTSIGYMKKEITQDITVLRSQIIPVQTFKMSLDEGIEPSTELDGAGTESSPFLIKNASNLVYFRNVVNSKGVIKKSGGIGNVTARDAYYKLTADIDLSGVCNSNIGSWIPIGGRATQTTVTDFCGSFDGNGYSITGLYIYNTAYDGADNYQGLFGCIGSHGIVKNLSVSGTVTAYSYGAIVVGFSYTGGTISGCTANGKVVVLSNNAAGIISSGHSNIYNCRNNADIKCSGKYSAGIVGNINGDITYGCVNTGTISGVDNCGGISGSFHSSKMYNCVNIGDVSGRSEVGGITGNNHLRGNIYNCFNQGTVSSTAGYVGGIVGSLFPYDYGDGEYKPISNCYNVGTVNCSPSALNISETGGICGSNIVPKTTISNNYWLYDPSTSLGIVQGIGVDEGKFSGNYSMTKEQMDGTSSTNITLYTSTDGQSYSKLCDALNAWAYDFNNDNNSSDKLFGWKYDQSSGIYPTLTETAAKKPEGGGDTDVFLLSQTQFDIEGIKGTFNIEVTSSLSYFISSIPEWISEITSSSNLAASSATKTHTFIVEANTSEFDRSGYIVFCNANQQCVPVIVIQKGMKYYTSTDYSADGKVKVLQSHTVGDGVKIIFTGDGFVDQDYADGTFDIWMTKAMDNFFTEEPYKSLRNRFDVYSVTAVSPNREFADDAKTVFNAKFGDGTLITGNNNMVFSYAEKVSDAIMQNSLITVVLNSPNYAGTCYMYSDGAAIAYLPIIDYDNGKFAQVIHHEAGGHGFSKLLDEYANSSILPESEKQTFIYQRDNYGFGANVDITNNPAEIQWSAFLTDGRYTNEVGIFEGALTYEFGAWRSTDYSIMRYNTGGYNAPSRNSIYKRIMKLSGESYSWEKFLEYDAINRTSSAGAVRRAKASGVRSDFQPLHPPVFVNRKHK